MANVAALKADPLAQDAGLQSQRPASSGAVRRVLSFVIVLLLLAGLWEGYKLLGAATGGKIPLTSLALPIRSDDRSMPHLWDMVAALFKPAQRGSAVTLLAILLRSAWFTWREALMGFVVGSGIGLGLGALFSRARVLERGLMPYVVASQTVPLLAIAPMIVIWGGRLNWPPAWSVSIISAYLTFFPVTINTLRGLRSPAPAAVELMRSYAASDNQILWKLRFPAALPYIFTALKISASASVIGAVVGELPSGIGDGLGRQLLTFSYFYTNGPEKLFAAIIIAALVGIGFVGAVTLLEHWVLPSQRRLAD